MFLRVASVVTALLVGLGISLMIDLGVPSGQALAQYYPPPPVPPYPLQSYPAGRQLPPPVQAEQDDDLDALGPPRSFGFPGTRPPQPGIQYGGRAVYPQEADPYALPPPSAYPNAPPPGYGAAAPTAPYPGQDDALRPPMSIGPGDRPGADRGALAALPPDYQPETGPVQLPPQFRRTVIDMRTKEPAGTIIIDTPNTYLYLVLGNGKAMRYGIGVGREGFNLGRNRANLADGRMARLAPASRDDRPPALFAALHGGRREQSARCARALSRQDAVPDSRHQPAVDHRDLRVIGLHQAHQ